MPTSSPRRFAADGEWDVLLVVAAGGAVGSAARWALTLPWSSPGTFPIGTWVANTTGAFGIGVLLVCLTALRRPSRYVRPFLGVGVLGGYTTWSTFMLDVQTLVLSGEPARAAAYLLATLAAGIVGAWAGAAVARLTVGRWTEPNEVEGPPR